MCHRAIRKIGCMVQKSLLSVKFIGDLTKLREFDALTLFSEIKEKNCSPIDEDLFFVLEIGAKIALPEMKNFFF